ncbi:MAG: high-potential iron-sulfur protein [Steroidobacteraceae bacterium]
MAALLFPFTDRVREPFPMLDAHTRYCKEKAMSRGISRRHLMIKVLAASALLPAFDSLAKESQVAGLTPLDTKDSAASALGFVTDASNASSNPFYKKGQRCASCIHFLGQPSDTMGACNIYAGRSVPANGWCLGWSLRPG